MTIQAIATRYNGYRFRSRLEARWAVAFDKLGVKYEYEAQGLLCPPRLGLSGTDDIPYLPDFWFPDHQIYGEVKGSLTEPELFRLLDVAASLSADGRDMVVFGTIPSPDVVSGYGFREHPFPEEPTFPTLLHFHKGDLRAGGWGTMRLPVNLASDAPDLKFAASDVIRWLIRGSWGTYWGAPDAPNVPHSPGSYWYAWMAAYGAARSARFEHGQSGA